MTNFLSYAPSWKYDNVAWYGFEIFIYIILGRLKITGITAANFLHIRHERKQLYTSLCEGSNGNIF